MTDNIGYACLIAIRNIVTPIPKSPKQTRPEANHLPLCRITSKIPSRRINKRYSVYLFFDSELQLGKSKESINQRIKLRVTKDFKSFPFWSTKKKQPKSRQALNEIFFNLQQCAAGASLPYFKINARFILLALFSKNISTLRSGSTKWQMNIASIPTLFLHD